MIRYPSIHGSAQQQLEQIKSYLHQLAQQLQLAQGETERQLEAIRSPKTGSPEQKQQAEATFQSIKALIIKSADVVSAYSDAISRRLEGVYVAQSAFGSYAEQTSQEIRANSTAIVITTTSSFTMKNIIVKPFSFSVTLLLHLFLR